MPQVDKQVQENSNKEFGEAADYTIGDDVPFKFVSAVPDMEQSISHDSIVGLAILSCRYGSTTNCYNNRIRIEGQTSVHLIMEDVLVGLILFHIGNCGNKLEGNVIADGVVRSLAKFKGSSC